MTQVAECGRQLVGAVTFYKGQILTLSGEIVRPPKYQTFSPKKIWIVSSQCDISAYWNHLSPRAWQIVPWFLGLLIPRSLTFTKMDETSPKHLLPIADECDVCVLRCPLGDVKVRPTFQNETYSLYIRCYYYIFWSQVHMEQVYFSRSLSQPPNWHNHKKASLRSWCEQNHSKKPVTMTSSCIKCVVLMGVAASVALVCVW
jgi:hypothetical protein